MPAESRAIRMLARVVAIAGVARQIDPAREGHALVHDDDFLVVAMQRALARVEPDLNAHSPKPVPNFAHVAAGGAEERQRGPRPEEDADLDPLRQLTEQVEQDDPLALPDKREFCR